MKRHLANMGSHLMNVSHHLFSASNVITPLSLGEGAGVRLLRLPFCVNVVSTCANVENVARPLYIGVVSTCQRLRKKNHSI